MDGFLGSPLLSGSIRKSFGVHDQAVSRGGLPLTWPTTPVRGTPERRLDPRRTYNLDH